MMWRGALEHKLQLTRVSVGAAGRPQRVDSMKTHLVMEAVHPVRDAKQGTIGEPGRNFGPVPIGGSQVTGSSTSDLMPPLTEAEQIQLERCEDVLQRGLVTFFEVGTALLTIREGRLYRTTHGTFESYCRDRWALGRSYSWRVIAAAKRLRLLLPEDGLPRPANECQMRPFFKLSPEEFPKAWKKAVERAVNGKITPGLVQAVIAELSSDHSCPAEPVLTSRKVSTQWKMKIPLGQVLVLLHEAKRNVEKGLSEQALAVLERIEDVVFGPSK